MKHLKSSLDNLKKIFECSVTAEDISEPFVSFEVSHPSDDVLRYMTDKDYDVVGIIENGVVIGYVEKTNINGNNLKKHCKGFKPENVFPGNVPLTTVLKALGQEPRIYVTFLGQVGGIITRGDLQKIPVRIYLFGLVSLVEMQLTRIIKEHCPDDAWKSSISKKRLANAEEMRSERKKRNEDIGLVECLQFADKRDIVVKHNLLTYKSKKFDGRLLKDLKELRNELAHAQQLTPQGEWPEFVELIENTQEFLKKCETV